MEHEDDSDTNCNWCTQNNPQMIGKKTKKLRYQKISLRSTKILRRVLETWRDLLSLKLR